MANFIRSLCMVISSAFFSMIPKLYSLFYDLAAQPTLFLPETLQKLSNNIYVLVSVVMLFALATKLISAIVNPDLLGDSKKGVVGVFKRIFIALFLIIIIPFGFEYFYKFQTEIISKSLIEKVILGMAIDEGENVDSRYNIGQILASTTLQSVLYPSDGDECHPGTGIGIAQGGFHPLFPLKSLIDIDNSSYSLCDFYNMSINENVEYTMAMVPFINAETGLEVGNAVNANYYVLTFEYWGLLSVVVSGVIVYMLVLFCIDSAVRLIKMGFLELTAPISVIAYIYGGENVLKNWFKEVSSTAISFFVRVAALAFMALILTRIPDFISNFGENYQNLARLFLVIGTLIFVKKAPELIEKMLGIKINLQGGIGGRLGQMAGVGKVAQNAWRSLGTTVGNTAKLGVAAAGAGIGLGALKLGQTADTNLLGGKAQNALNKIKNSDTFKGLSTVASATKAGVSAGGGIKGLKASVDSYKKNPYITQRKAIKDSQDYREFANKMGIDFDRGSVVGSGTDLTKGRRAGQSFVSGLSENNKISKNTRIAAVSKYNANQSKANAEKFKEHYDKVSSTLVEAANSTSNDIHGQQIRQNLLNLNDAWKNGKISMDDLSTKVSGMANIDLSAAESNAIIGKLNAMTQMASNDSSIASLINNDGSIGSVTLNKEVSALDKASTHADDYYKNLYENSTLSEKRELDKYMSASEIINKEIATEIGRTPKGQEKYDKVDLNITGDNNSATSNQNVDARVNVNPTFDGMFQTGSGIVIPDTPNTRSFVNVDNSNIQSNNSSSKNSTQQSNIQSNNSPDLSEYFNELSDNIKSTNEATNNILNEQLKTQQSMINEQKNQSKSMENMSNNIDNLSSSMDKMSSDVNRFVNTSNKNTKDTNKKLDELNDNNKKDE